MKVKFLADANLDMRIVEGVCRRENSLDFQTSHAAALHAKPDEEVLRIAAESGRVLVTHDQRTMPAVFGRFLTSNHCPGVLIVPQSLGINLAVEDLLLVWLISDPEDWHNRIAYLPF